MFGEKGASSSSFLSGCLFCPVQGPNEMMNGSAAGDGGSRSTSDCSFKGRFIKIGPALASTLVKQSRGPMKMNGGNYQLYLFTSLHVASRGSRAPNLPAWKADVWTELFLCAAEAEVWLSDIILMQQGCWNHLCHWTPRSAHWHRMI